MREVCGGAGVSHVPHPQRVLRVGMATRQRPEPNHLLNRTPGSVNILSSPHSPTQKNKRNGNCDTKQGKKSAADKESFPLFCTKSPAQVVFLIVSIQLDDNNFTYMRCPDPEELSRFSSSALSSSGTDVTQLRRAAQLRKEKKLRRERRQRDSSTGACLTEETTRGNFDCFVRKKNRYI